MIKDTSEDSGISRFIEISTEKARLLIDAGLSDQATELYAELLQIQPGNNEIAYRLARLYRVQNRPADVLSLLLAIVRSDPAHAAARMLLDAEYPEQALALYSAILSEYPDNHLIALHQARLLHTLDRPEESLFILRNILLSDPFFEAALFELGNLLAERGDFNGAIEQLNRLLAIDANRNDAHNNVALCLLKLGQSEEAERHLLEAIRLRPEYAEAYNNLGNLYVHHWRLTEAKEQYRRSLELQPEYFMALTNLGRIYTFEGNIPAAVDCYYRALHLRPDDRIIADNLLFSINNSDLYYPEQICEEHLRLAGLYSVAAVAGPPRTHNGNRIRIGYVSPDFMAHSVGFFIEPVLRCHDRDSFDIFCYDTAAVGDKANERMQGLGWVWRKVFGLSDRELAEQIRSDRIDILVDLAGHTEGNRLGVFALRPAQVQVTWLGYPNTTGLPQIDYRLTDNLADPPGMTDHLYSEKLVRLPRTFLCYAPPETVLELPPCPEGQLIFCSFNNLSKISDTTIGLWARILKAVPTARLLLKNGPLGDQSVRDRLLERFAVHRIDRSRLILDGFAASREEHLQRYNDCHIALDSFPYCGTTTTFEALWMGVPVVTLAGCTHVSRVGVSILTNAGLPELIACNPDAYVDIALNLSLNRERIAEYRLSLRERLVASPLLDSGRFTVELERAYGWMLQQQSPNIFDTERI